MKPSETQENKPASMTEKIKNLTIPFMNLMTKSHDSIPDGRENIKGKTSKKTSLSSQGSGKNYGSSYSPVNPKP